MSRGSNRLRASDQPIYDGTARVIRRDGGHAVWCRWDHDRSLFDLYCDQDCAEEAYIGCADSYCQAGIVAREFVEEVANV